MRIIFLWLLLATFILSACSDDQSTQALTMSDQDMGDDQNQDTGTDLMMSDGGQDLTTPDMSEPPEPLRADQYCESIVDFFCPYYIRCGRMAGVTEVQRCQEVFLETCNSVYEPYYIALEERDRLSLSAEGIAQCRDHLEQVTCEAQLFDLDGGCANIWRGQAQEGEACGPGIESFICAPGTTCRLGTDFCGTCVLAGQAGEACVDGTRCIAGTSCVNDVCVTRAAPGENCNEENPCVSGASCTEGVCEGFSITGLSQACDRARRCPYKSECIEGFCVESALQSEACTAAGCASGFCEQDICVAPVAVGASCQDNAQCLSGLCNEGLCQDTISACLTR